jgi:Txe/YoeB family toxin of Txe-Axe toxin-antitoxin module
MKTFLEWLDENNLSEINISMINDKSVDPLRKIKILQATLNVYKDDVEMALQQKTEIKKSINEILNAIKNDEKYNTDPLLISEYKKLKELYKEIYEKSKPVTVVSKPKANTKEPKNNRTFTNYINRILGR